MSDDTLLAELATALRPFAEEYDQRRQHLGAEPDSAAVFRTAYRIMVGDLRKARAALSKYDARRLEAIRNGVG